MCLQGPFLSWKQQLSDYYPQPCPCHGGVIMQYWYREDGAVLVMYMLVIGLLLSCYSWLSICYRGAGAGGDRRDGVGQDDADGAVPTTVQSPNELLRARRCWW